MNLNALLLAKQVKITRIMNGVAAGQTAQTSSAVNMAGYDGCLFIGLFGALTSTQVTSMKAQQSSDDGSSDAYSDLAESSTDALADADGNKMLLIDIFRPEKQYLKAVISRGTANAVIDGIIAIQYAGRDCPITQGTTVKELVSLVTPAEGTA
jgi:hypothetical protein